jgi:hypothetical protein
MCVFHRSMEQARTSDSEASGVWIVDFGTKLESGLVISIRSHDNSLITARKLLERPTAR